MTGTPVPERIANAPEILPWLNGIYTSFVELATCRYFDEGQIPWTAIREFALLKGYADTHDEFERFSTLIRDMDQAYIEHQKEKFEKNKKKLGADNKKPPIQKGSRRGR